MIRLTVNGRPVELPEPTPLTSYLGQLGVNQQAVAVEIDGHILARSEFAQARLEEGARVEIVRMVGGG